MTTRLKGFVVTLEQDTREDDAESTRLAILALRNVIGADPVPVDISDHLNRVRIKTELQTRLWDVVTDKTKFSE